ncbi:hypothetical protein EDB85DRAFT_1937381 [Lactarius pseudohatsudake]|nr:hypothetical protein EDB85DRAFT_1937381 [Lactarius pseudohatsudake]
MQLYPALFTLAVSSAAVELGLTAYLVAGWRGGPLLTLLLFNALCTVLSPLIYVLWSTGGNVQLLSNLFGSIFWIFAAAIVWGSAMGYTHNARAGNGCKGNPSDFYYCPHFLSPRSLAWIEFMLCVITLFLSITWVRATRLGLNNQRQGFYV